MHIIVLYCIMYTIKLNDHLLHHLVHSIMRIHRSGIGKIHSINDDFVSISIVVISHTIHWFRNFCHHTDAPAPPIVKAYPLCKPGKVGVFWTPPTLLTGSTITGYSIQYRIGSSGDYTTATDPGRGSISTTISGLQLGKTYQVRVGARTELGVGTTSYQILLTNSSGEFVTQCKVLGYL